MPGTQVGARSPGSRANVLFVTADQWRGDCLGAAGHPVVRTPAMDRLASEGVRFASHWANTAPCGPSRATIYTGLYAMNHRSVLNGTPLDRRFTNFALEARAAGYDPLLFGYTDTSADPRGLPVDDPALRTYEGCLPGFRPELMFTFEALTPWLEWLEELGYPVDHSDPHAVYRGVSAGEAAPWAAEHSEAAFLTDSFLSWLDGSAADDPSTPGFFAHLSYLRPHPPYLAPAPYHEMYDPAEVGLPRAWPGDPARRHPLHAIAAGVPGVGAPTDEDEMRRLTATYYGMVSEVDHQIGRVLAELDRRGLADQTLVVVTSDHGEQMGEHGLLEKLGWWDASYHVPCLVRDPRSPGSAGRVVESVTEHVDLLPTVLEWLGLSVPVQADGRSLLAFVHGDGTAPEGWRTTARWEWDFRDPANHLAEDLLGVTSEECSLVVSRGPRHTYVHFAADALPDLLFDRDEDPDQVRDRHSDPEMAAVVAEAAASLLSWRMRHADRSLTCTVLTPAGPVTRVDPRRG